MIIGKNLVPEAVLENHHNLSFVQTNEFPIANIQNESATKSVYVQRAAGAGDSAISFDLSSLGIIRETRVGTYGAIRPHPILGYPTLPDGLSLFYTGNSRALTFSLDQNISYAEYPEHFGGRHPSLGIIWGANADARQILRIDDFMIFRPLEFEKKPNIGYTLRDIDLSRSQTNDFGVVNTIERNTIREIDLDFSLLTRSEVTTLRNFFLERKSKPFFLSVDDAEDTLDKVSLAGKFYIPDPKEINHLFKDYFSTSLTVREFV